MSPHEYFLDQTLQSGFSTGGGVCTKEETPRGATSKANFSIQAYFIQLEVIAVQNSYIPLAID